jgi:replicative DNA helicase
VAARGLHHLISILIDNRELDAALAAGLTAPSFFRDVHQRVFRTLVALHERRSALDLVTVKHALEASGDLEEVGVGYLSQLVDGGVRSTNLPYYVGIVQDAAARRAIILQCRAVIERAAEGELPAGAVLDEAVNCLLGIGQTAETGALVEGAQLADEAYKFLEQVGDRRRGGGVSGVPTGFVDLDAILDGFQPGQLIVLAGRTSEGKTALATQFALASESCAFFSCEMERIEVALRSLAVLGRLNGWALKRGLLSADEHARTSSALDLLRTSGVAIDDTSAISVAQIRAKARRRQRLHGLKLVVVDYLQLMSAEVGRRKDATREQEVTAVSRGLKALAKDLKVPVVALSQFNRALKPNEEPTLAHLRESGAIEQDANVVLLIHRPDGQTVAHEGDVRILIAKNRGGPKGAVTLKWHPTETRFSNAPTEEAYA